MTLEIWTEKYRPKSLKDVINQTDIVRNLMAFVENKNMPHLLFAGPAGVGKTTCALALAKDLYGSAWRDNVLELNASDERGIDVIRHKVKDFARTRPIGDFPFKIIILDEADALTKDAQQALRRTMEKYTQTCRFILIANYSSRIIDPIQSRCTVFRFKPLPKEDILRMIKNIAEKESLQIDEKGLEAVYEVSEGDARRAINILQACASLSKTITEDLVFEIASVAKPKELLEIMELALKKKFVEARNKLFDVMLRYGLSGVDVIKQIQRNVWKLNISDEAKVKLIDRIGEYEFRMVEGSDEFIQLEALLAYLALIGNELVN